MTRRHTSMLTALTVAIMAGFLIMSYKILEFIPLEESNEALLVRAPKLTTDTWAVFDPETGDIRYGNKTEEIRPIASIAKLFTAYMVMYTGSADSETTITWGDLATEEDFGKLVYGEKYSLRLLLFPLLIESSNDAGAAITRALGPLYRDAVGGVLSTLGLLDTSIIDGTGLSQENVSSPRDLARFFVEMKKTYPHITDISQLNMYHLHSVWLVNNSVARGLPSFRGGKQGFTPEAGKTFVGTFLPDPRKKEVGVVLLGSTDLKRDLESVLSSLN